MAQRRMFSTEIVESDEFLDMPDSSQSLYFHLAMRADDDGFVQPRSIMKLLGSSQDDLKVILGKRFVLPFENGVVVIKHWLIHNMIRADRYKETRFMEEKKQLYIKENKAYTDNPDKGKPLLATKWQPNGNQMAPQVRLGKDSNEVEQAQHSLEEIIPTDDEGNPLKEKVKNPRNQSAIRLQRYYTHIAQEQTGMKTEYGAGFGAYTMLCSLLKKRGEQEVKELLEWYVKTEKFEKFKTLTAALSTNTITLFDEDTKIPQ